MFFKRIFFIALCCFFCIFDLFSMNAVATGFLNRLRSVDSKMVGITVQDYIRENNTPDCNFNNQVASVSRHLRVNKHFGNDSSILRTLSNSVNECFVSAQTNPSLFNVRAEKIDADTADGITKEVFNLLFSTERVSFFVPESTNGGNRITLKANLSGHSIPQLKSNAGMYSLNRDVLNSEKIETNTFIVCIGIQKIFTDANGKRVSSDRAQCVVVSVYPDNPNDEDALKLTPVASSS